MRLISLRFFVVLPDHNWSVFEISVGGQGRQSSRILQMIRGFEKKMSNIKNDDSAMDVFLMAESPYKSDAFIFRT